MARSTVFLLFLLALAHVSAGAGNAPPVARGAQSLDLTAPTVSTGLLESLGLQKEIQPVAQVCCKICTKGKACGNTCIARDKTCHVPRGCACDG